MSAIPSIDYRCARCGASSTYQLVPQAAGGTDPPVSVGPGETPSIDFRCSACGTSQTYKLVPDNVRNQPE